MLHVPNHKNTKSGEFIKSIATTSRGASAYVFLSHVPNFIAISYASLKVQLLSWYTRNSLFAELLVVACRSNS